MWIPSWISSTALQSKCQTWLNWLLSIGNLINNKVRESSNSKYIYIYIKSQNRKSKASPTLISGNILVSWRILLLQSRNTLNVFACWNVIGVVCQVQFFNKHRFWLLNKYSAKNLRMRIVSKVSWELSVFAFPFPF